MTAFDLDTFLDECLTAVRSGEGPPAIRAVLDRVSAQHASVPAALGEPTAGEMHTLHHGDELTVLNVVWTPGMRIGPHDHEMTAGIVVYGGHEDNAWFRPRGDGGVEPAGGTRLRPGDVTLLGRDAIHAVRAHPSRYTGAIHVYAGDFFARQRRTWDDGSGDRTHDPRTPTELFEEAEAAYRSRELRPDDDGGRPDRG